MHTRVLAVAAATLALSNCATPIAPAVAPHAHFFAAPSAVVRALPFSEAVQAGDFLFVSGQVGVLPANLEPAPGGIVPEARQALDNIEAVLQRHGSSLADVVKCTVFLADMKDWPAFNEVYRQYFKVGYFPARSALGASGLALGARAEVECIAYVPGASAGAGR